MTHACEKLRLRLACSPGLFFGLLPLFDVDRDAKPGIDLARFIEGRAAPRQKPAVAVVPPAQSQLDLVVATLFYSRSPALDDALAVFGMNCGNPPVAECFFLGEAGVLVPVGIEVRDLPVGTPEPHDLRRELEQILESASGGECPTLELGCGEGDAEQGGAGGGHHQSKLVRPEHGVISRSPPGGAMGEEGGGHPCVVHPGDGETHEQSRPRFFEPGPWLRACRDEIASESEGRERAYDRNADRCSDDERIVEHVAAQSHSGHASVVHTGYCESHEDAGHNQKPRAYGRAIEDGESDGAPEYCRDKG